MAAKIDRSPILGLAFVLGIGCTTETDDLDPQRVDALAQVEGSAQGSDFSGPYFAELKPIECECSGSAESSCEAQTMNGALLIAVEQRDGFVRMRALGQDLIGAVDRDGSFAVGAVYTLDVAGATTAVTRIDGSMEHEGSSTTLRGLMRRRDKVSVQDEGGECNQAAEIVAARN